MRILVYKWKAYNYADILETFTELGYEYITVERDLDHYDEHAGFEAELAEIVQREQCEMIFSVNYFALITTVCQKLMYLLPAIISLPLIRQIIWNFREWA